MSASVWSRSGSLLRGGFYLEFQQAGWQAVGWRFGMPPSGAT